MKKHFRSLHPDTLLVSLIVVFLFGMVAFVTTSAFSSQEKGVLACTQEAMICPDGSAVTRTGPYCTFAPCRTDGLPNHPGITEEPFEVPVPKEKVSDTKQRVVCTQEVQACSDGSFVGRAGPQCQFAPCPSDLELDSDR